MKIIKARQVYYNTQTEQAANIQNYSVSLIANSAGNEYYHSPFKNGSTREDFGIVYVINGDMDFYIKDKIVSLSKGGFIIGAPHSFETYFGTKNEFLNYYWLNFTGSRAEPLIKELGFEYQKSYNIGIDKKITRLFNELFDEFLIKDQFFQLRSEAKIISLLSSIASKIQQNKKTYLKSVDYIHKHYNEEISVKYLAELEHLSYSHYNLVFNKITGMAPIEYIITQRINNACFYLAESSYSISEISKLVGYDDQCYFSRIFKNKTGLSPIKYRNNKISKG